MRNRWGKTIGKGGKPATRYFAPLAVYGLPSDVVSKYPKSVAEIEAEQGMSARGR